jgi:hypothetical protein
MAEDDRGGCGVVEDYSGKDGGDGELERIAKRKNAEPEFCVLIFKSDGPLRFVVAVPYRLGRCGGVVCRRRGPLGLPRRASYRRLSLG